MNVSLMNLKLWLSLTVITAGSAFTYSQVTAEQEGIAQAYIIQGASQSTMTEQINAVGGNITHTFSVINAVSAALTPSQMTQISSANPMLRLFASTEVEASGRAKAKGNNIVTEEATASSTELNATATSTYRLGADRDTLFPTIVRANEAHALGITGDGVAVAIIDTGMESWFKPLTTNIYGNDRVSHAYNVTSRKWRSDIDDYNGHGTHIASLIGNSTHAFDISGEPTAGYNSIAPGADLVIVKAFDENGRASYADILSAIEYVVENSDALNIKVLNLSFSATPSSNYWDDPINQALMVAWQAGITVVAAAGNQGPGAMTIGVPGNNPYIITVGAMSDNYTPDNVNDDFVTSFSSAGPTYEGFVKPELVAPGGHIQGLMDFTSSIAWGHEQLADGSDYYSLSGSSQSTAITSGVVALMLQESPTLSPDDIKCRLVDSAKAAVTDDGQLAFSVFQQGAGLVDAMGALNSSAVGCGNAGLNIAADIAGEQHYMGPAKRHPDNGEFYIPDQDGLEWDGLYSDAHLWGNIRFISDAHLWGNIRFNSDAHLWGNIRFISDAHLWGNISFNSDAHLWGNIRFISDSTPGTDSIETKWVDHE